MKSAQQGWRPGAKRVLDVTAAGSALVVLSPLLIAIAVAVRTTMGSPVLFRQTRAGFHGRPFSLWKFRTMADLRDASGKLLADSCRITRLGRFLRSTSLDELPQVINVIRGELSLVGPRPLLMSYLDRYTPEQARRHEVLPGMAGWAQVNGRNALSWPDKFRLDVWYVDHWSLWLDLRILAAAIWSAASREGISAAGEATMPEFMGENFAGSEPEAGGRESLRP